MLLDDGDDYYEVVMRDGTIRRLRRDEIVPDGATLRRPLFLKDQSGSAEDAEPMPSGYRVRLYRAEAWLEHNDPFVIEQGRRSLQAIARSDHPQAAQQAAALLDQAEHRLSTVTGRAPEPEPRTAEEAHALMRERMRNAWRTGR
jgi:hypothetical protein